MAGPKRLDGNCHTSESSECLDIGCFSPDGVDCDDSIRLHRRPKSFPEIQGQKLRRGCSSKKINVNYKARQTLVKPRTFWPLHDADRITLLHKKSLMACSEVSDGKVDNLMWQGVSLGRGAAATATNTSEG